MLIKDQLLLPTSHIFTLLKKHAETHYSRISSRTGRNCRTWNLMRADALKHGKFPRKYWKTMFLQARFKLGPNSFKFDLYCWKQSPPSHLACIANHPKPCIFMKGKYKSYLEPQGDITNQWNNYTKQPEDTTYMVIYGSVGGESVVEEQCEDTYSSKWWHPFLLAARFSFLQSTQ